MIIEAIRSNLEKNGWEVSKQFPTPFSYFKKDKQINLSEKSMALHLDGKVVTVDNMRYLENKDALVQWFVKS